MTFLELKRQLDAMRSELSELVNGGRSKEAIDQVMAMLELLQTKNLALTLELARLRREHAGQRSERIDPTQLSMMLEKASLSEELPEQDLAATEAEDDRLNEEHEEAANGAGAREKRKPRRRRPPASLPRDVTRHELSPEERMCVGCEKPMGEIGVKRTEILELVPAHFRVKVDERVTYACSRCKETVVTAPGAPKLIRKGLAGPGLMAHVVQSKFEDNIPLSHLVAIYARGGVSLSTLCGWIAQVAGAAKPLADRIHEKGISSDHAQFDGSGMPVLDRDDPNGIRKGAMWCLVGDERYVSFRYARDGTGEEGPWKFLKDRKGTLQADGASVFDRLYTGEVANATEVGCWCHGRRKFEELKDTDMRVAYPLKLIAQLYRVESLAQARGLSPEERQTLRESRSLPITERLERWITRTLKTEPPASALAKACGYFVNQRQALMQFLWDGELPLDTNFCERQIRSLVVGRRNYLFAGSDRGAENAATLYTIVRTAALAKIDTYAYLIQVIERLAEKRFDSIDELLPENYTPTPAPAPIEEPVPV
jgi:transposase